MLFLKRDNSIRVKVMEQHGKLLLQDTGQWFSLEIFSSMSSFFPAGTTRTEFIVTTGEMTALNLGFVVITMTSSAKSHISDYKIH